MDKGSDVLSDAGVGGISVSRSLPLSIKPDTEVEVEVGGTKVAALVSVCGGGTTGNVKDLLKS